MPAGNSQIVKILQSSLALHWSAIEAYTLQSRHYSTWGYPKLAEKYAGDAEEERQHVHKIADRLEFFDETPTAMHESVEWPRHDFAAALDVNYDLEQSAANIERGGYSMAVELGDAVTAELFKDLLSDSEASLIEIEAIREVIDQIGLDNYLANQA
jgi:bacterioferritin